MVLAVRLMCSQIDLLENPAIEDVVVLSVVLEEVKNKNLAVYNRIKALCTNAARKFFVFSNEYHRQDSFISFFFCFITGGGFGI